jgi:hypothetical protein
VLRIPDSPRKRRRLIIVGSVIAIAAVVAIVAVSLGNKTPPNPVAKGNEGPAQLAARISKKVSKADRAAINRTLDAFVPAAVGRQNGALARSLAGPALTSGSTLKQWERGNLPVVSYPLDGTTDYHGWRVLDATKTEVDFSLILHHPKNANIGDWIFQGAMIKVGGRWLVNGFYTAAINNPVRGSTHEVGPADFAAGSAPTGAGTKSSLGRGWLVSVFASLGGIFVVMALIGVVVYVRGRAARRRARAREEDRASLPPLPGRPQS